MDIDPLSCLIATADILEEFCRPKAEFGKLMNGVNENTVVRYDHDCSGAKIELNGSKLDIVYLYKSQSMANIAYSRRKQEVREYFNADNGFIDLSPIGITEVDCDTAKA